MTINSGKSPIMRRAIPTVFGASLGAITHVQE